MKKGNIFKGVICLLLAIFVILLATGKLSFALFAGLSTAKLIWTIILGIIFIGTIISMEFDGSVIFGGILLKMYEDELGFHISVPMLILVMILLIMAINFLMPKKHHKNNREHHHGETHTDDTGASEDYYLEDEDGSYIYARSRFTGISKYITSNNFEEAVIDSQFGGVELYFNNAKVPSGHALIELQTKFSGVEIYIPKHWKVVRELRVSMGDYHEDPMIPESTSYAENYDEMNGNGTVTEVEPSVTIHLVGHTEFGGVKINRI